MSEREVVGVDEDDECPVCGEDMNGDSECRWCEEYEEGDDDL